jgi:hypothetical protein
MTIVGFRTVSLSCTRWRCSRWEENRSFRSWMGWGYLVDEVGWVRGRRRATATCLFVRKT